MIVAFHRHCSALCSVGSLLSSRSFKWWSTRGQSWCYSFFIIMLLDVDKGEGGATEYNDKTDHWCICDWLLAACHAGFFLPSLAPHLPRAWPVSRPPKNPEVFNSGVPFYHILQVFWLQPCLLKYMLPIPSGRIPSSCRYDRRDRCVEKNTISRKISHYL